MNKRLIHEKENSYFVLALIMSVISYIALIVSVVGIAYIVIGALITFFIHGLSIANIRSNGVKLSEHQFPKVYETVKQLSSSMGVAKIPEVFVVESAGFLNAFATKFFGRDFIVLYSDIFELVEEDRPEELNFIIAHELAHVKRKHVTKSMLILPALWMPFLGEAYSRACEYSCDRIATAFTGNAPAGVSALTVLAIGKKLSLKTDVSDYIANSQKEKGFFIWLSKALSTHPPIPLRISEIEDFARYPQLFGYSSSSFEVKCRSKLTL